MHPLKAVLPNGLRVLVQRMEHTGTATAVLLVGAGSRYEREEEAGAFHFIEHLCFKGTRRYPTPRHLSEAVERVGGVFNASTDREVTAFWCKVPYPHLETALDVLAEMVLHPLFDPEEVEKERQVVLEELALSHDYPDHRVALLMDRLLWPGHPLGRDVGGTPETVRALPRETLLALKEAQYRPNNAVVSIAGRVDPEAVVEMVRRRLGEWEPAPPRPWAPAPPPTPGPRVGLERRRTEEAHIALGVPGLSVQDPDRYAQDLLNTVLGEGMSSRLFLEVRERQGLAYEVHSTSDHFADCGALVVYAGVDPRRADRAVATLLRELERLADDLTPEELEKAREMVRGRLLMRMEDTRAVAFWWGAQELLLGETRTVEEVLEQVSRVDPEACRRLARRLFRPESLRLAVVGPFRSPTRFERLLDGHPI